MQCIRYFVSSISGFFLRCWKNFSSWNVVTSTHYIWAHFMSSFSYQTCGCSLHVVLFRTASDQHRFCCMRWCMCARSWLLTTLQIFFTAWMCILSWEHHSSERFETHCNRDAGTWREGRCGHCADAGAVVAVISNGRERSMCGALGVRPPCPSASVAPTAITSCAQPDEPVTCRACRARLARVLDLRGTIQQEIPEEKEIRAALVQRASEKQVAQLGRC